MEKQLIITLVSKQAVVAVQFIKWVLHNNKQTKLDVLLLTNSKMNYCAEYVQKIFIDDDRINFIDNLEISENNYVEVKDCIYERVSKLNNCYENVLIDITLGKKIMSIGVFQASIELFSKFPSLSVYYQDNYNKSIQKIFPGKKEQFTLNLEDLTIENYFNSYGFSYKKNNCLFDYETSKKVPKLLAEINKKERQIIDEKINANKLNSTEIFTKIPGLSDNTVTKIEDFVNNDLLLPKQINKYLFKGQWFEEYCYFKIKEELKIKESRIAVKVKITKQDCKNTNQIIDIAYLDEDNFLHIVDCKSFISNKKSTKILKDSIHKFKSIASELGLNSKNDLILASKLNEKIIQENAILFGINIIDDYIN